MADSDQDKTDPDEPCAERDAEDKPDTSKGKHQKEREPKAHRQERVQCEPGESEQREAQKRGTFDLELSQHEHQQTKLRKHDQKLGDIYSTFAEFRFDDLN